MDKDLSELYPVDPVKDTQTMGANATRALQELLNVLQENGTLTWDQAQHVASRLEGSRD